MSTPGRFNFTIYQGATLRKQIRWTVDGTPVDISKYVFRMQVRRRKTDTTVVAEFNSDQNMAGVFGGFTADPDEPGVLNMWSTAEQSSRLPSGTFVYDILAIETATDDVVRLLEGTVKVDAGTTRTTA